MTQETYSPKRLALELGFTEALADHYEERGTNATSLRKIARAMDMPSMKPKLGKPKLSESAEVLLIREAKAEPKKHKHSYRKDGTCRCGVARKVK